MVIENKLKQVSTGYFTYDTLLTLALVIIVILDMQNRVFGVFRLKHTRFMCVLLCSKATDLLRSPEDFFSHLINGVILCYFI